VDKPSTCLNYGLIIADLRQKGNSYPQFFFLQAIHAVFCAIALSLVEEDGSRYKKGKIRLFCVRFYAQFKLFIHLQNFYFFRVSRVGFCEFHGNHVIIQTDPKAGCAQTCHVSVGTV
jgi:hypothetical protein